MEQPQFESLEFQSGITGAVASRIGGRNENQDSYLIAETPLGIFVTVCDGMGGGPAGKTASLLASRAMTQTLCNLNSNADPLRAVHDCVVAANNTLLRAIKENPNLRGMGTTCIGVLINSDRAYIVHAGDSRVYLIRGGKAVFRTDDHSYVGELVHRGSLTEEEARNSNYSNVITRAVGVESRIEPEVAAVDILPGDRIALMTDGVWGAMPESELVEALSLQESPEDIVNELTENVDNIGLSKGGGYDNLTVGVLQIPETFVTESWVPAVGVVASSEDDGWSVSSVDDPTESYEIEDDASPAVPLNEDGGSSASDAMQESGLTGNGVDNGGPEKRDSNRKSYLWGLAVILIGVIVVVGWLHYVNKSDTNPEATAGTQTDSIKKDSIAVKDADRLLSEANEGKGDDPSSSAPYYYGSSGASYSYSSGQEYNDSTGNYPSEGYGLEENNDTPAPPQKYESTITHSNPDLQAALRGLDELRQNYPQEIKQSQNPDAFKERMGERVETLRMVLDKLRAYRGSLSQDSPNKRSVNELIQKVQKAQASINLNPEDGQPAANSKNEINTLMDAVNRYK